MKGEAELGVTAPHAGTRLSHSLRLSQLSGDCPGAGVCGVTLTGVALQELQQGPNGSHGRGHVGIFFHLRLEVLD